MNRRPFPVQCRISERSKGKAKRPCPSTQAYDCAVTWAAKVREAEMGMEVLVVGYVRYMQRMCGRGFGEMEETMPLA